MTSQPETPRPHESDATPRSDDALETIPVASDADARAHADTQPGADRDDRADARERGRTVTEEFKISGEAVIGKVKELVREGNVRRIVVANEDGRTLLEIPLTIGVIGTVLLPVWAALGAVAALAANLTLRVERRIVDDEDDASDEAADSGRAASPATPVKPDDATDEGT